MPPADPIVMSCSPGQFCPTSGQTLSPVGRPQEWIWPCFWDCSRLNPSLSAHIL